MQPRPWNSANASKIFASLLAADTLALLIATALILVARGMIFGALPSPHFSLWAAMAVWFGVRAGASLYAPFGLSPPEKLQRSFFSSLAAFVVHLAITVSLTQGNPAHLINLLVWPVVFPLAYALRAINRSRLVAKGKYGVPIVIIGNGPPARRAIRELLAHADLGYVPVGVFSTEYAEPEERQNFAGVPVIGRAEEAPEIKLPYPIHHAMIVVSEGWDNERNRRLSEELAARYPHLQIFSNLTSLGHWLARSVPLGPYLVIQTRHRRFSLWQRFLKRLVDLAIALPLLIILLPFMAIAAIAIVFSDPGPIFFAQLREGRNRKPIRIFKLRSMAVDAEAKLAAHLAKDTRARFEFDRTMKLRRDPRIIPHVGQFIRKSSLDEVPQLWSVIRGDMSLVGPRVMPTKEVELYSIEGQRLRRQIRPGVTGFWQVESRSDSDFSIREVADSFYVANWSIWLDIWIIFRTVRAVTTGAGAY